MLAYAEHPRAHTHAHTDPNVLLIGSKPIEPSLMAHMVNINLVEILHEISVDGTT